jgi:hypothetical protein
MLARLTSAIVRGCLVAVMILIPSLLVPTVARDTSEIVLLVALFAAVLTTVEYAAVYPSIVEFRDAPPFNRIRYISLFVSILLISVVCRGEIQPSAFTNFVQAIGLLIGQVIDFPYSPVRLMLLMLPPDASFEDVTLLRTAAGLSYLISLMSLGIFVAILRFAGWPQGLTGFNVWTNLPTFDPTSSGDVVQRLIRDARVNIALGFFLPFLIPVAVRAGAVLFDPVTFGSYHTLIWTTVAWAFLPASLFMRGIAMRRVADMIADRRRRSQQSEGQFMAA